MMRVFFLILVCVFYTSLAASAVPVLSEYNVVIDTAALKAGSKKQVDSTLVRGLGTNGQKVSYHISRPHIADDNTLDFYLLLGLCAILGGIKTVHPKYFNDVWRAFINPTLGSRQLKDIIQAATFPNLLMNLYSSIVLGVYAYYLISADVDWRFVGIPSGVVVSLLVLGAILMYIGKYAFVQFTGWAFKIKSSTEQYNFNIFLVNKILGMALLPFIICFAFLDAKWDVHLCIISAIFFVALLINRYLRSWNIFAPLFQDSRFHFFMYLCAFEILPLAVLLKLVMRVL